MAIVNHMRVRANLTGRETRSVMAFLQAMNGTPREQASLPGQATAAGTNDEQREPTVTEPQAIARGQALVHQKACVGCHVIGSGGGEVGPALNGVIGRRGGDYVRRKLANPAFSNAATAMPNFRFTHEQIETLVAFLTSLDAPERASATPSGPDPVPSQEQRSAMRVAQDAPRVRQRLEDPEVAPEPPPLVLKKVYFGAAGSALTPASYQILDEVAASLLAHPDVQIEIAGYTDHTGSPQLNRRLSQARAEAVMAYLTWRGVPLERLVARGYGSERPIAQNTSEYGRTRNRRVEFRAIPER